jgi:putative peptide zinc metalloprotease protein
MSVWQQIQKSGQEILPNRVNVWAQLAEDLTDPELLPASKGVWGQVSPLPGGVWQNAREETLLLRRKQNIWSLSNDATIQLRPRQNIWNKIVVADGAKREGAEDLWELVDEETFVLSRDKQTVWAKPMARNFAKTKPQRSTGWALKELTTALGETYWVLKHLDRPVYLRLDKEQLLIWNMLDGSHSVQDIAVECFVQFGTFNIEGLSGFLNQLAVKGFLVEAKADMYQDVRQKAFQRTLRYRFFRAVSLIFQSEIGFPVDPFYSFIYKFFGWIFYNPLSRLFFFLIALVGAPVFFMISGQNNILTAAGKNALLETGFVGLLVAQVIIFFIHESAHALTTTRYGRHVRRGGVGLYFGMVAFFMDTTDIWMEPRGPRLSVTWAGPYSGFIIGGICSLLLYFFPNMTGAQFAFQVAAIGYLVSISNMNPLLKFDGYYILMDWLEVPMLRERSIKFVRKDLWGKVRKFEKFSREEVIFTLFGIAALAYTALMIFLVVMNFGSSIVHFVVSLFS